MKSRQYHLASGVQITLEDKVKIQQLPQSTKQTCHIAESYGFIHFFLSLISLPDNMSTF